MRPLLALLVLLGTTGAVDVGDTVDKCTNVTTATVYQGSNTTTSKVAAAVITPPGCEDSTVVKVTTDEYGLTHLDLEFQGIQAVESLPAVGTVNLQNNIVQSFETGNSISTLYLANNSITSLASFSFPNALTELDLSYNEIGSLDDATFPTSLETLTLSNNPIGSIQGASFPSGLFRLAISDASLASLENFSFPSSVASLNFTSNPITRVAGVIFPSGLVELTLLSVSTSASSTISVESTLALYDSGTLTTVLEEFEVRQTDAALFETLVTFDVSTTSTLECSDPMASPYYVQDTMLCVISDSYFASKYAAVVKDAPSGAFDSSGFGSDGASGSVEKVLPPLEETMEQSRTWFLIVAAGVLGVLSAFFCVCACCKMTHRRATRSWNASTSKLKSGSGTGSLGSSNIQNQLWHAQHGDSEDVDAETQRLLDRMMASSPRPLDSSEIIAEPLEYLERNLSAYEIPFEKLDQLVPMAKDEHHYGDNDDEESASSRFSYLTAVYRHGRLVLKRLEINLEQPEEGDGSATSKMLSAFVQEIHLSSTLSHSNLVSFMGFVVERPREKKSRPTSVVLAMEYMDRGNLNDLIEARRLALESRDTNVSGMNKTPTAFADATSKAVTWEDATEEQNPLASKWSWFYSTSAYKSKLAIAIDVARALEYMHSLSPSLFHGNLSSRKIFFDKQWNVKLGDFTSCSALRRWSASTVDTGGQDDRTSDDVAIIHLDMTVWSAPEVVDGRQYTEQSDIYSFGILLSQLDVYDCPSDNQAVMEDADIPLLFSNPRRTQQPSNVDGDAPSLVNLLMMQCRAFQPEDRPSASEVLHQLLRIEDEIGNVSSTSITSFY